MTNSFKPSDELDPGLWIKNFDLERVSASDKIYGNGRQQAAIRLSVQLLASQPPLTQAQKDSLLLVRENLDGSYDILTDPGTKENEWSQTLIRDDNFDMMPGSNEGLPKGDKEGQDPNPIFSKVMYVSTTAIGAQTAKLRAMIRRDATTAYYTDKTANFDRYVELTTVTPPVFDESDYTWTLSHTEGNINNVFLHEYRLQLRSLGLAPVTTDIKPGMVRWHYNRVGETYATYVGMVYPGTDPKVHYEDDIDTGPNFRPAQTAVTNNQAALILVLNGADNLPFYSGGLVHDAPCKVKIIDRHGNDHEIMFAFSEEGSPIDKRTNIKVYYS